MIFTHSYMSYRYFTMWHSNQPVNTDGTQTTIITTIKCDNCGHLEINMHQSPIALVHGQLIIQHDDVCADCAELYEILN